MQVFHFGNVADDVVHGNASDDSGFGSFPAVIKEELADV